LKTKVRLPSPVIILLLILAVAAVLRLQHIKADPPRLLVHLTYSAGIYFDEGMYCHNARNKILFGTWVLDDWNPLVYNAILTGIYYAGFKLFGISIVTVKVINILFGLLGITFVYLAVRRYLCPSYSLAIAFLFAFDFYWTMYNRIGLLENFSTLFFIISYYFLVRSKEKSWNMALVGIFVSLAALSKYLFLYFFLTSSLAVLYEAWQEKKRSLALKFFAGCFSILALWFLLIYIPFSSAFRKIGSGWADLSWPENVGKVFFNIYRNNFPRFMSLIPLIFISGLFFSAMVLLKLRRKNPRPDILEFFVFLWIVGTFFEVAILNYQPLRYYLPIVPGLFLALSLVLKNRDWLGEHKKEIIWVFLLLAAFFYRFWIGLVIWPSAFLAFNHPVARFLLYPALVLVFLIWLKKNRKWEIAGTLYILCSLALSSLLIYYAQFYRQPEYRLESIAARIRTLPPGSVLMGNEAPRLALETNFRFFVAFEGWFNDEDPFRLYRPTHLLVLDKFWGGEIVWIKRRFPEIADNLILYRRLPIWDTTISLYKVNYPPGY
jgi:4-amino-4-deoxy-L-arabinose transferase-like glycosyltransferase